ncbi:oligosaccharide flippase family protein [Mycoplasmatota bacterium zrk1]
MKNTFIKNTLTLSISGLLVKGLGLVNRIIITRILGSEGIGLYMMSFPTIILFISLAQLGLPIAISKLISENRIAKTTKNSTIIYNSLSISLFMSCILIIVLLIIIKPLTGVWLGNPETFYPILTTIILIPLVSFSGVIKGYLHGLKLMKITSIAHIAEQVVRITTSVILVYILLPYGLVTAVFGSLLSLSIGEVISIIILLFKVSKISPNAKVKAHVTVESKDILEIAIPATSNRLIGSLTYFFEPIIFSLALREYLNTTTIKNLYGNITGFAISLMLIPSFLTHAISTALLPSISESYSRKDFSKLHYLFRTSMMLVFIPSGIVCILLSFFSYEYMNLLFATTSGANYVTYMAPFFLIFYFQAPIVSILHGLNKSRIVMVNSLILNIIKLILLYFLCSQSSINSHGLPIASIISALLLTLINFRVLSKIIKVSISNKTKIKVIFVLLLTSGFAYFLKSLQINYLPASLLIMLTYILLVRITNLVNLKKLSLVV